MMRRVQILLLTSLNISFVPCSDHFLIFKVFNDRPLMSWTLKISFSGGGGGGKARPRFDLRLVPKKMYKGSTEFYRQSRSTNVTAEAK